MIPTLEDLTKNILRISIPMRTHANDAVWEQSIRNYAAQIYRLGHNVGYEEALQDEGRDDQ